VRQVGGTGLNRGPAPVRTLARCRALGIGQFPQVWSYLGAND
jgi:hypothetical protein